MTIFIGTILKKLHFYFKISIEFVYFHIRLNLPLKVGVIIKQIKITGFPGEDGKESACNVGDLSSTPGLGRSPGEGNDSPVFFLENLIDRGAWQATFHGVPKSQTQLSD